MTVCRILSGVYAEGWKAGDVVDITNPTTLIAEGKVELLTEKNAPKTEDKELAEITKGLAPKKPSVRKHDA